jgi:hypothetical protein
VGVLAKIAKTLKMSAALPEGELVGQAPLQVPQYVCQRNAIYCHRTRQQEIVAVDANHSMPRVHHHRQAQQSNSIALGA